MGTNREVLTKTLATLNKHQEYLKAVIFLSQEPNTNGFIDDMNPQTAKNLLQEMNESPIQASILVEALDMVLENGNSQVLSDLPFDRDFLRKARTITAQINDNHFFENKVLKRLN